MSEYWQRLLQRISGKKAPSPKQFWDRVDRELQCLDRSGAKKSERRASALGIVNLFRAMIACSQAARVPFADVLDRYKALTPRLKKQSGLEDWSAFSILEIETGHLKKIEVIAADLCQPAREVLPFASPPDSPAPAPRPATATAAALYGHMDAQDLEDETTVPRPSPARRQPRAKKQTPRRKGSQ